MDNFGVIEIASTTTKTTPGWAYVPDTGPTVPAALQPTNRKRAARNQPALTLSDLSAREETRLRKELEALDKESHRDVNIPIPPRPGRAQTKHTPNVRKILQSQKTFANHLDDYQAMLALAESNPAAAAAMAAAQAKASASSSTPSAAASKSASPAPSSSAAGTGSSAPAGSAAMSKRAAAAAKRAAAKEKAEQEQKKRAAAAAAAAAAARQTPKKSEPPEQEQQAQRKGEEDVEMTDAAPPQPTPSQQQQQQSDGSTQPTPIPTTTTTTPPLPQTYPRESQILPPYPRPPPRPHPGDTDPLLISRVPAFPSDDELRALMTAPPLSYLEARAKWPGDGEDTNGGEAKYPVRVFCAVCGYWGRVKCMKCGTRVCALECLETHREECITRYGL